MGASVQTLNRTKVEFFWGKIKRKRERERERERERGRERERPGFMCGYCKSLWNVSKRKSTKSTPCTPAPVISIDRTRLERSQEITARRRIDWEFFFYTFSLIHTQTAHSFTHNSIHTTELSHFHSFMIFFFSLSFFLFTILILYSFKNNLLSFLSLSLSLVSQRRKRVEKFTKIYIF